MRHIATVTLPIRAVSVANLRENWRSRAGRAKAHRLTAWAELRHVAPHRKVFLAPLTVTLTRIAPRALDGHDNLRSSLKACVDGVADFLGLDDGSDLIDWQYRQHRGPPKTYQVRVEIHEAQA